MSSQISLSSPSLGSQSLSLSLMNTLPADSLAFANQLVKYLTQESSESLATGSLKHSEISLCHCRKLTPAELEETQSLFERAIISGSIESSNTQTDENFQKADPSYTISSLKPDKQREWGLIARTHAQRVAELRVDAFFHKGMTLYQVNRVGINISCDFVAFSCDFEGQGDRLNCGKPELDNMRRIALRRANMLRRLKNKKLLQTQDNLWSSLDDLNFQLNQIKLFSYVAGELNVDIGDLTGDCVQPFLQAFNEKQASDEKRERELLDQEEAHDDLIIGGLEAQFIAELEVEKAELASKKASKKVCVQKTSKQKKKKKTSKKRKAKVKVKATTKEKTSVVQTVQKQSRSFSPEERIVFNLNAPSCKTSLTVHSRVARWQTADPSVIQGFNFSYNASTASLEELEYLRATHNLSGIERILSNAQLLDCYSYSYEYTGADGTKNHRGRGFYTKMVIRGDTHLGLVQLGISEGGNIYHAVFNKFPDRKISPDQLGRKHEIEVDDEDNDENAWTSVSQCSFNREGDGSIHMKVGKTDNDRVDFYFYPLT